MAARTTSWGLGGSHKLMLKCAKVFPFVSSSLLCKKIVHVIFLLLSSCCEREGAELTQRSSQIEENINLRSMTCSTRVCSVIWLDSFSSLRHKQSIVRWFVLCAPKLPNPPESRDSQPCLSPVTPTLSSVMTDSQTAPHPHLEELMETPFLRFYFPLAQRKDFIQILFSPTHQPCLSLILPHLSNDSSEDALLFFFLYMPHAPAHHSQFPWVRHTQIFSPTPVSSLKARPLAPIASAHLPAP